MNLLNFTDQISEEEFEKLKEEFINPFSYYDPMIEINAIIYERNKDSKEPQRILIKITELGQEKFYSGILNIKKTKENEK